MELRGKKLTHVDKRRLGTFVNDIIMFFLHEKKTCNDGFKHTKLTSIHSVKQNSQNYSHFKLNRTVILDHYLGGL